MDDKLKYFLYAAQNLSFTKTAAHFFISTTAVSKAIANLEEKIGFPLFKRRYNSLELTQAGRNFYENARFIALDYENAIKSGQHLYKDSQPQLTIGFSSLYESWLLTPLLNEFRQHHKITFNFTQRSIEQLAQGVSHNIIDLAYSFGNLPPLPNLEMTTLHQSNYLVGISCTSSLSHAKVLDPSALQNQTCGYYSQPTSLNAKRWLNAKAQASGYLFKSFKQYETLPALLLAVATDQCFAFFPDFWDKQPFFPEIKLRPTTQPFDSYKFVEFKKRQSSELCTLLSSAIKKAFANK
ncbi:LysR family transcriptional regulator [Liquorilactobacillus satsumensis]|uniref:HTH lysR-type domain-containing protein n=1 Tax=Liquorilactobacillus satsumensis DSM 16230 = JCM 12392 TaxID=1423801 RepID=A0A0R1V8V6_9LACO|nr:LysR family transcriptional regulator [Liquorilactobacillus satsumensis]KRL99490.1 hypothetical protein FD50_GL000190 [Liquorilactobacillus satsumensis DSM 16230 = JCM 12392]MCP9312073.1 LysR family transcriptional regulator [Liquorilactobacillus satsumensis]MCP9359351.1 LysR family transcriptional regulator [Liquorilactobacillus satsumensis]